MQRNAPGRKLTQRSIFGRQKLDLGPYLGLGQGIGLGPIFTKFFGYSYTYRLAYQRCSLGWTAPGEFYRLRMLRSRKGWGLDNMKSS